MTITSSVLSFALLILLCLDSALAEPPDKERTHIWLTPWSDASCQGVPSSSRPFSITPSSPSSHRSTFPPTHLIESLKDGGVCTSFPGPGNSFSSFSYTLGKGIMNGKLPHLLKPGRKEAEGRGSDEKNGGMCILEVYRGMNCGTRQAGLFWGWEDERPLMVVLNATSSEYGNMDKCHHLKDLTQHTARSVWFDCRMSWIFDYIVPHTDGENTN